MFPIEKLVWAIVYLVLGGLACACLWWFVQWCEVKEPFLRVAKVCVGLLALFLVLGILFWIMGHPIVAWN